MRENNQRINDWLSARVESKDAKSYYSQCLNHFTAFAKARGKNLDSVVEDWRATRIQGIAAEQIFQDEWTDIVRSYSTHLKSSSYAPLTVKNFLVVLRSFFKFWKVPIDVDLPRRPYVLYHNRDLQKEEIRQILARATARDRCIFLIMAESGMRGGSAINLKYWQIKEDLERDKIPMRILTPASTLKDHVGPERWTFIGEDGNRTLKEYLKPRQPLEDEDYVFQPEKPGKMKGEQVEAAGLSVKFNRIVRKIKIYGASTPNKPGQIRLHGLRKYFRNNMKADSAFREFWMGHTLGVDDHYLTKDPEIHRREYVKGYKELRILEVLEPDQTEIQELKKQNQQLEDKIEEIRQDSNQFKRILEILRDPQKLKQFEKLITNNTSAR